MPRAFNPVTGVSRVTRAPGRPHGGRRVKVAGLVASCREREGESGALSFLTLEDEYGTLEVQAAGCDPEDVGPVVVAEGAVEERYGAPSLVSARLERHLPGGQAAPARSLPAPGRGSPRESRPEPSPGERGAHLPGLRPRPARRGGQ